MTAHPSHPDQLMARTLGVCWHSPTSDRWPCQVIAEGERQIAAREFVTLDQALACGTRHGSGEICVRPPDHDGQHHGGGDGLGWYAAPLADWEVELLRPCGACGCTEMSHEAHENDSACRIADCDCDAFRPDR